MKKLLISSDYIIFLTEKVKNHFQNLLKADLKNSSVIPCASDYSFFDPSLLSEERMSLIKDMQLKNKLVLGYLGSIGPLYDFERIFESYKALHSGKFKYIWPCHNK